MDTIDRYRGCLLGLAVGDALGTSLEFSPPGSFAPITDMIGGGPFHLNPGEWTDDTSMALCLAESLVEKERFDPVDQLERYLRWYQDGHLSSNGRCFDIGNTTRQALHQFIQTHAPYCGSTDPYAAGNGSLMRLAPVPMFFASDPMKASHYSGENSRTTHGAIDAVDACRYYGGLIAAALNGVLKQALLQDYYEPTPGYWQENPLSPAIEQIARGSYRLLNPPEIKGSGFVVKSMEAALWALFHSQSFEEGCLKAVNLGDDADTTGAIYGQLAGAIYGESGIPQSWLVKLAKRDLIETFAEKLFFLSRKIAK